MYTVIINTEINVLYVAFKPSTTYKMYPGAPALQLVIILYACTNIDSKYSKLAHMYCSLQPYVFYQMGLIPEKISCPFFNSLMIF